MVVLIERQRLIGRKQINYIKEWQITIVYVYTRMY